MAHECPECYMLCHCGGDIDDIQMDGTIEQMQCRHCEGRDDDDDENEDWHLLKDDEHEQA